MSDGLKTFLTPNINRSGRIMRAIMAILFLLGAWFAWPYSKIFGLALLGCGIVGVYEAFRGWCFLRACGVKTKL